MIKYQKIETLYEFDSKKHTFKNKFYNPIVEYLKDVPWLASQKIDGMNIRVHWDGHKVEYNGRTDDCNMPKEVDALLNEKFKDSEVIFEQHFGEKEVYLFMECYGGKIQGYSYGGQERLIGFDVMIGGCYLDKTQIKTIFDLFGIETVNFFEVKNLAEAIQMVEYYSQYNSASEYNQDGKTTPIEGLVCVPKMRLYDHQGNRIIVKIKCRDLRKMDK